MTEMDNKTVYSTVEFETWAHRERLNVPEQYLIEHYLDSRGKTMEAGTAGGKILLALKARGFSRLYGFDFVPNFIEEAKRKDATGSICFEVQDAVSLNYADSSFDQVIYLGRIISFIEDESSRFKALEEAIRVLKPGGIALFSFLCFDARSKSIAYIPYVAYLRLLRMVRGSPTPIQYLPWLKHGGVFNKASLLDSKPHNYWFKLDEIYKLLLEAGFQTIALGSSYQVERGEMATSYEALVKEPIKGMLYFVCKRRVV